jgi:hypothetical protein
MDALDAGNMMTDDWNMGVISKEIIMEATPAIKPTPMRMALFFHIYIKRSTEEKL